MSKPLKAPPSPSENSLGGRVARYAQVGTSMAGQAARLAGNRLFSRGGLDKGVHANDLRAALGGLKGPLMKVAQMLATIPDALPPEYADELAKLQSSAPPMGKPFVRRRMASELGPDWRKNFVDFDLEAAAAASLGQVHRATLADGRLLACKLQYPNIESAVDADLSQLKMLFAVYRRWDKAIDTSRIYEEIAERLREEVDYEREARHIRLYKHILADEPTVSVPDVLEELSTRRLLTMGWLEGKPLMDFRSAPQEVRDQIAIAMFRAWYIPFYRSGVIHGDPHLGNYTVRADHGVNLLDFGCVRVFPPSFVRGVIDLYWALSRGDRDLAVSAYERWGFKGLSNATIDVLNEWAAFLYAPLMKDEPRLIAQTNSGQYGREVAHKVHQKLREVGGVTPPREFVFMDRAAVGLGSVFMHLKANINWYRLFVDLIGDFDEDALAKRQNEAMAIAGLTGVTADPV
jgi:predicted unusual protein kinase regulating ubiquinone biosynthesis (AarF/ABC1/UbiB family)